MDFTQMSVWQKALEMLSDVYQLTGKFPNEERYGLSSDMRRAANSVAHNIAEGSGRFESRDKTRFYKISRGSAFELISQSYVSSKLEYCDTSTKDRLESGYRVIIDELNALIKSIETK